MDSYPAGEPTEQSGNRREGVAYPYGGRHQRVLQSLVFWTRANNTLIAS
ncbi:MAG TPA: hypothetical protein VFG04_11780 [Planctomycetaceae bacterium]|nr:hypothetical protein [Planctomycetaceae bacterium]